MPKHKPEIILLTSRQGKNTNSIIENYLDNIDFINIPKSLLDGIYVTLNSGEKYKINKSALKEDVVYEKVHDQILQLGVPDDIQTIEVVLDTSKTEKYIKSQTNTILDSIFTE